MKFFSLCCIIFLSLVACEKEQNKQLLGAYFKYTIDGVETTVENGSGVNNNIFTCDLYGDTAIYINVSKLYSAAGFFVKANALPDGNYVLNNINKGYYTNPADYKRYSTNNAYTGQVTFQRGTFQANTMLNTLKGTFSYQAVDTLTNKSINVINGSFLMEITEH